MKNNIFQNPSQFFTLFSSLTEVAPLTCFPCSPAADEYFRPSQLSRSCPTLAAASPPGPAGSGLKPWGDRTAHPAAEDVGSPVCCHPGSKQLSLHSSPVFLCSVGYLSGAICPHFLLSHSPPTNQEVECTRSWDLIFVCRLSTGHLRLGIKTCLVCWHKAWTFLLFSAPGSVKQGTPSSLNLGQNVWVCFISWGASCLIGGW